MTPRTAPRKRPRQERARSTVDAMVEATGRLLEQAPPDALTTNGIAERAGVSIGTLYQYFPAKEALLAAAARRELDRVHAAELERVHATRAGPLRAFAEATVGGLAELFAERVERLGPLMRGAPALGIDALEAERLEGASAIARQLLQARAGEIRVPAERHDVVAFAIPRLVSGLVKTTAREHPQRLREAAFRAELIALTEAWLLPAGPLPAAASAPAPSPAASQGSPPGDVPRPRPRSPRALATVERVLAAATRLMMAGRFERLTAKAIAREAGVAVGTLYTWFPTKEAIVATLLERDLALVGDAAERTLAQHVDAALPEIVAALVGLLHENYRARRPFYRALLPNVFRLGRDAAVVAVLDRMAAALEQAMARHPEVAVPAAHRAAAAFLLSRGPNLLLQAAAIERPALLDQGELLDELLGTCVRFLARPAARAAASAA